MFIKFFYRGTMKYINVNSISEFDVERDRLLIYVGDDMYTITDKDEIKRITAIAESMIYEQVAI